MLCNNSGNAHLHSNSAQGNRKLCRLRSEYIVQAPLYSACILFDNCKWISWMTSVQDTAQYKNMVMATSCYSALHPVPSLRRSPLASSLHPSTFFHALFSPGRPVPFFALDLVRYSLQCVSHPFSRCSPASRGLLWPPLVSLQAAAIMWSIPTADSSSKSASLLETSSRWFTTVSRPKTLPSFHKSPPALAVMMLWPPRSAAISSRSP
jgi:hypothetical protein